MARGEHRGPWIGREPGRKSLYIYWYEHGTGRVRRRSAGTDDRERAQEALGLFIIERARSQKPTSREAPERYPVATALRWYAQERAPELASAAQIGFALGHLIPFFKKTMVAALTPELLQRYTAKRMGEGIARGTVRRELAVLSAAIGHAVKNNRLTSTPVVRLPPPGAPKTRHLDEAEIRRLLDACRPMPHLYLWTMLALNTAARKSALLELTWTQVQFEQGLIYLNPEGRDQTTKGRAIVPISASLRAALEGEQRRREAMVERAKTRKRPYRPSPFVIEYRGGRVVDIKKAFAAACAEAKLEGVTPHTLRHTAASLMAKHGVDLHEIAKVLGHSYQKTTELYAHLRPEWLREAVDILGRATGAPALSQTPLTETIRGSSGEG